MKNKLRVSKIPNRLVFQSLALASAVYLLSQARVQRSIKIAPTSETLDFPLLTQALAL